MAMCNTLSKNPTPGSRLTRVDYIKFIKEEEMNLAERVKQAQQDPLYIWICT